MITEFQGKYRFLSNFWRFHGITVEHLYQAQKCFYQKDAFRILEVKTPGEAKRIGKEVVRKHNWESIKIHVMYQLLLEKFSDPELREKLLATGDEILQEGNYWNDEFWGINLRTGKGQNHLGHLLMKIRDNIKRNL